MASHFQQSGGYLLQVWLRIPLHRLRVIAPPLFVDMVVQHHNNNSGLYSYPSYDSDHMNHAPMATSSQPETTTDLLFPVSGVIHVSSDPRNSWNVHQEQRRLHMSGPAAGTSFPADNSTFNPLHATPSFSQEIMDHRWSTEEWRTIYYSSYDVHDTLFGHVQETDIALDSTVDPERSQDEEIYKGLKTRTSREEDEVENNICAVCLDDFCAKENGDETIATLDCGHEYHTLCIKRWIGRKNVCPLCRAVALPQLGPEPPK